jgi:hypothetical protein
VTTSWPFLPSCILAIGAADVGSLLLLVQYGPLWANKYFW